MPNVIGNSIDARVREELGSLVPSMVNRQRHMQSETVLLKKTVPSTKAECVKVWRASYKPGPIWYAIGSRK